MKLETEASLLFYSLEKKHDFTSDVDHICKDSELQVSKKISESEQVSECNFTLSKIIKS
jgi:hypothetical protein